MKKILIIGAGPLQLLVVQKAKEMGLYTIVVDGNPNAKGLKIADKKIIQDINDAEKLLSIAINEDIDGVIHPCSEIAIRAMGRINEVLGLCGINEETAIKATNKELMRMAFEVFNAPSPISKGASNIEDAIKIVIKMNSDVIFKPSRNSGSRGVTKLDKFADNEEIIIAFNRAMINSYDKSIVIEQYIDGPEFSVEIVIWNNHLQVIAVTDKLTSGEPNFVELGHNQPSLFTERQIILIKDAAINGCVALGLNNCVAHVEIKLQDDKAYLIEIGARMGGDFISTELVHLSTGIDLVAAAIDMAIGNEPNLTPKHQKQGAAIRYFTPNEGKLIKLSLPKINNNIKIYDFEIYRKIGDVIPSVKSSIDRSGHVITIGINAEDAINSAENVINSIKYEIAN